MKPKIQTTGITFYTSPQMYKQIKKSADYQRISNSELIRIALEVYLREMEELKEFDHA
jgi:hypothetical protein